MRNRWAEICKQELLSSLVLFIPENPNTEHEQGKQLQGPPGQSYRALTRLFLMGCLGEGIKPYLGPQQTRESFPGWEYNEDTLSSKIKHVGALLGLSESVNLIYSFLYIFF